MIAELEPLTAEQAARRLGVHVNTLKRLPPAELPYFTIGTRGDRRYQPRDVSAYISRRTVR